MSAMFADTVAWIRDWYQVSGPISLHEPRLGALEKTYLQDCIDSSFVSSVGPYVTRFEADIQSYTQAGAAVATQSGTSALHLALLVAGVKPGDEVLTQPLTFVATANAIRYCQAEPVWLDVNPNNLGLSAQALAEFLETCTEQRPDGCYHRQTGRRIAACVPVHVFGLAADIQALTQLCQQAQIPLIEDAAEALGTTYQGQHLGTFGNLGILSFNGNKIVTCGSGGMLLSNDTELARQARHLSVTAKLSHPWAYDHDQVGYNYRMSNLNAAVGCAQLEQLADFVQAKRSLHQAYQAFFQAYGVNLLQEQAGVHSNYWLNALVLEDENEKEAFLSYTHQHGVLTRPCWKLMHDLPIYRQQAPLPLTQAEWLEQRIVTLPSGVRAESGR